jgi:hypothetical protein
MWHFGHSVLSQSFVKGKPKCTAARASETSLTCRPDTTNTLMVDNVIYEPIRDVFISVCDR